jgi:hypothetical protein
VSSAELDEEQEENHDWKSLVNTRQSSYERQYKQQQEDHWQNIAERDVGAPSGWIHKHSHAGNVHLDENACCKQYS